MNTDLYAALGLKRGQTYSREELRAAFRAQAKRSHPDLGGSADAFNTVRVAYATLSDPELKHEYDTTGNVGSATETREDRIKARARDAMLTAFQSTVRNTPFDSLKFRDLVDASIKALDKQARDNEKQLDNVDNLLEALEEVSERLEWEGAPGDVDLLQSLIENDRKALHTRKFNLTEQVEVLEMAMALLELYTYRTDKEGRDAMFHKLGLGTSSTFTYTSTST